MRERRRGRFGDWKHARKVGIGLLLRARHHPIVQNALALYAAQFAGYLLPLATVPYLARILGPGSLGLVAFAQALGVYVALVVEYGFHLSGTREVVRHRTNPERLAEVLAGVTGARLLLVLGCLGLTGLAQVLVLDLQDKSTYLWIGVLWGSAFGIRPLWYFLGIERVRLITMIDISTSVLATGGIFYWVHGPEDGMKVLLLQTAGAVLSTIIALLLAYRHVGFRLPRLSWAWKSLRMGWDFFVFRVAISLYTASNVVILGLFAPAQVVGFYAGPEKINRAVVGLLNPITQALYPHATKVAGDSTYEAARIARIAVVTMGLCGAVAGFLAYVLAPLLVPLILGPGYESSVSVFRVLALLLPILGISTPLGVQWMFPLGLERIITRIGLVPGVLHILLALLLGSQFGAIGAAWAIVTTETCILFTLWAILLRLRLNPFSRHLVLRDSISSPTGGVQDAL